MNFYFADDRLNGAHGFYVEFAPHQFMSARIAVRLRIPVAGKIWRTTTIELAA